MLPSHRFSGSFTLSLSHHKQQFMDTCYRMFALLEKERMLKWQYTEGHRNCIYSLLKIMNVVYIDISLFTYLHKVKDV